MQRDIGTLARHPLGAPEFSSFYLLQHGSGSGGAAGGGANDPWWSYSCHGGSSGASVAAGAGDGTQAKDQAPISLISEINEEHS